MFKNIIFKAFYLLVLVHISSGEENAADSLTEAELTEFKKDIEKQIAEGGITCENYNEICEKDDGRKDPDSPCRIILKLYKCDGKTDIKGLREIVQTLNDKLPHNTWVLDDDSE